MKWAATSDSVMTTPRRNPGLCSAAIKAGARTSGSSAGPAATARSAPGPAGTGRPSRRSRAPAGQRADGRAHGTPAPRPPPRRRRSRTWPMPRRPAAPGGPPARRDGPDAADAKPTSARAASKAGRFGASALAALASASAASKAHSTRRRSAARPQHRQRAHSAASSEGTNSRPPMPVDMPSSSAMGASRPTGSISDVTTQKVLRPAAATAASRRVREQREWRRRMPARRSWRNACRIDGKTAARCRMPRHARRGKRNLSAPDVLSQSTDSSALIKYLNCQTLGTIRGQ